MLPDPDPWYFPSDEPPAELVSFSQEFPVSSSDSLVNAVVVQVVQHQSCFRLGQTTHTATPFNSILTLMSISPYPLIYTIHYL